MTHEPQIWTKTEFKRLAEMNFPRDLDNASEGDIALAYQKFKDNQAAERRKMAAERRNMRWIVVLVVIIGALSIWGAGL